MKTLLSLLGLLCLIALTPHAAEGRARARAAKEIVNHVVAFKFKDTATAEQIREVEDAFAALPGKIREIKSFRSGTNISPEKLDKGFTHGFILTFQSEKDRDAYLVHPDHKAFGALVGPVLADVFVIDFWSVK